MLDEEEWEILIDRIKQKACTPFLGAGACAGVLPLGRDVAQEWAAKYGYPFEDTTNLIRVAQFVAVRRDRVTPKELFLKRISAALPPDFDNPLETHRALADLRLKVYLTTNYDPFMVKALRHCEKDVRRDFYRWNRFLQEYLKDSPSVFERQTGYFPSPAQPLVFHLHGYDELANSLVLTEDDYIDFLVNISQDDFALPPAVRMALTGTSLLFVGYSIADWNFRVLLNSLNRYKSMGETRLNVAVMMPQHSPVSEQSKVQEYLTKYYADMQVRVYWGKAAEFFADLRGRMGET